MNLEKQREIQHLAMQLVGAQRRATIRAALTGALALIDTVSADLETVRDHLEFLEGTFTAPPPANAGAQNRAT